MRTGTTLNLLKFPIMNPTPYRMLRRLDRLNTSDTEMSQEEHRRLAQLTKQGYLVGKSVGLDNNPLNTD